MRVHLVFRGDLHAVPASPDRGHHAGAHHTLEARDIVWRHDEGTYAILGLNFGLLIGHLLYTLVLYLSVGERAYLVYVGFVRSKALHRLLSPVLVRNSCGAAVAVLTLGVFDGMLASIGLSVLAALRRFSQPVVHELGELGLTRNYVDLHTQQESVAMT